MGRTEVKSLVSPLAVAEGVTHQIQPIVNWQQVRLDEKAIGDKIADPLKKFYTLLHFPDIRSQKRWENLSNNRGQISVSYNNLIGRIRENPQGNTIGADTFATILNLSTSLVLGEYDQNQRKMVDKYGSAFFYEQASGLGNFRGRGDLDVKINGLSLKDLLTGKGNPSLAEILEFSMQACLVKDRSDLAEILAQNQIPQAQEYPELAMSKVLKATKIVRDLFNTDVPIFKELAGTYTPHAQNTGETEILNKALEVVRKSSQLKHQMLAALFNPQSPQFQSMKKAIFPYLTSQDPEKSHLALLRVGINEIESVITYYRLAKEFAQISDGNSDFFTLLATALENYGQDFPFSTKILFKEEVPWFFSDELGKKEQDQQVPTIESFKETIGEIFQKSGQRSYALDPNSINWENVLPPTSANVEFLNTPFQFILVLDYQQGDQELRLAVGFDCHKDKNQIRWSFIDSPDDPQMQNVKNALLQATQSALINVREQAEAEFAKRAEEKRKQSVPVYRSNGNERKTKPVQTSQGNETGPKARKRKAEGTSPLTPNQNGEFNHQSPPPPRIKQEITQENLARYLQKAGFSVDILDRAIRRLERFNLFGGRLQPLVGKVLPDQRKIYELRTGGYRWLVSEVPNGHKPTESLQRFEVVGFTKREQLTRKIEALV